MKLDYHNIKAEGKFTITNFQCGPSLNLLKEDGMYKIIWCNKGEQEMMVDGYDLLLKQNQVLFCTPNNIVEVPKNNQGLIAFVFNREFYCIQHNDEEVSCNGLLFYGSSTAPVISLSDKQSRSFEAMLLLFQEEFETKDRIQGEMLRTLLKRVLITSTRLLKENGLSEELSIKQLDLFRQYNILVEQHFKENHQVSDYAAMLYKSPKTLSNLFKKNNLKSPLQIINERIVVEAKRLLRNSQHSAEEIAFELGYNEASHFSKFFKKHVGISPLQYRKDH
ncbi:AraC family transcriptional regulator [Nonlabens sp. SCSIO 43208]|uniref:helix-turn-helix domain-containing protein n=1 Tax=Nonlabens sp. SCSIO 43208 TaxID=2793009 RepID=UPI003D6C079A